MASGGMVNAFNLKEKKKNFISKPYSWNATIQHRPGSYPIL
jgi:hypothetical protein